jgi:hypothetical protein
MEAYAWKKKIHIQTKTQNQFTEIIYVGVQRHILAELQMD